MCAVCCGRERVPQACLSRCNTASVDGVVWKVPELDATPGKQVRPGD